MSKTEVLLTEKEQVPLATQENIRVEKLGNVRTERGWRGAQTLSGVGNKNSNLWEGRRAELLPYINLKGFLVLLKTFLAS